MSSVIIFKKAKANSETNNEIIMITKVTAGHELESLHSSEEDDNMAVVSDFSVIKST